MYFGALLPETNSANIYDGAGPYEKWPLALVRSSLRRSPTRPGWFSRASRASRPNR